MAKVLLTLRPFCCCCCRCNQEYEIVDDLQGSPTGEKWYHGKISHREAARRLRESGPSAEDGTYLVYDTPRKQGEYVLLVYHERRLHRCKILRRQSDNKFVLGADRPSSKTFSSVEKLIKSHRGFTGTPFQLQDGGRVKLRDYVYVVEPGALFP